MATDGFEGIFGAGGMKTAAGPQDRGDDDLIAANAQNGRGRA